MKNPVLDSVATEVAGEKSGALGRAGTALQEALRELTAHDARGGAMPGGAHGAERDRLLRRAAWATLSFVAQREACGLRDPAWVFRYFDVPEEVIAQMGKSEAA